MIPLYAVIPEEDVIVPTLPVSIMTMHQRHGSTPGQFCGACVELLVTWRGKKKAHSCALYSLAKTREAAMLRAFPACGAFHADQLAAVGTVSTSKPEEIHA